MNNYPRFKRGGLLPPPNIRPQSYYPNQRGNFRGRGNSNFPRQNAPRFGRGRSRGGNQNSNFYGHNTQRFNMVNQKPYSLIHQQFSYEEEDPGQFDTTDSGYGKADIYYSSSNDDAVSSWQTDVGVAEEEWIDGMEGYEGAEDSYGNYVSEGPEYYDSQLQQVEEEVYDYEGEAYMEQYEDEAEQGLYKF